MRGLELFEMQIIMILFIYQLSFWYFHEQFLYRFVQFWFVSSFEIFEHLTIEKCDEIWYSSNVIGSRTIAALCSVARCKYQIGVVVGSSHCFEFWFYTHTRWALGTPEVKNHAWVFFNNFLQLRIASNSEYFTTFWIGWTSWLLWSTSKSSCSTHTTKPLHQLLHLVWIHVIHHLLQMRRYIWRHTTASSTRHSRRHASSSAHATHTRHTTTRWTSCTSLVNTWRSLLSYRIIFPILIKYWITLYFKPILSILHHWCNHCSQWR